MVSLAQINPVWTPPIHAKAAVDASSVTYLLLIYFSQKLEGYDYPPTALHQIQNPCFMDITEICLAS